MRRVGVFVLSAALVLVATSAQAQQRQQRQQQRGGRGGGFTMSSLMLLSQKSVQDELKLGADQVSKVEEAAKKEADARQGLRNLGQDEQRAKFREMRTASDKVVADILKPDQAKRLKQIALQQEGARALAEPEVAQALNLTDDQKTKLRGVAEESAKQMRELFQGGQNAGAREKLQELRKSSNDKAMAVLTDDQKAKLKELQGEPFKGEIRFGGRRPQN